MRPGEPCPGKLIYEMDFATVIQGAQLPAGLRARLNAAEAAGSEAANTWPLEPFPPQPESAPAVAVTGDSEGAVHMASEEVVEEMECEPCDSRVALLYKDDTGPDVYVGMDKGSANTPVLPMPTAVPPSHLGSCERRHCRFHAAEGVQERRLSGSG